MVDAFDDILFSGHALRRMFQRGIIREQVKGVLSHGETIADYPDDSPYPSRLILGFVDSMPLHVIFAEDRDLKTGIIVTAYIPDVSLWGDDFRRRRET